MSPARLGVTAQGPSHTFTRVRPPHAPCHPQSRADTVQTPPPSRQPRVAAAPRRCRPVLQPILVSIQVPGFQSTLSSQVPLLLLAHLLTDCAAPGVGRTRSRGAPGCAGTGQVGAGEWGCRIRRAGELLREAERGCGPNALSLPGQQHQLSSASNAAPGSPQGE